MFIGGRGDWTAVRLAALLRAARLSAHRGEEAHQQLQQSARTRLLRLKVCPVPPLKHMFFSLGPSETEFIKKQNTGSRPSIFLRFLNTRLESRASIHHLGP